MTGSTSADTKTTVQNLTPDQQSLVSAAMPNYQTFAASNPTLPGSAGVAGFDPLQTEGQQQVLDSTGTQQGVVGTAAKSNQYLSSGAALDPNTNPALKGTIDAAVRPIYDNLNETTLPQLSADASTGSGGVSANFGGSRQGIAEGLATKGANIAAGDTSSKVASAGYGQGLNAMLQSIGLSPTIAAAQTIPGTTTSTVGDVRQGQTQAGLTADTQAQQFAQWLPYLKAQLLTQGADALPGGSTTSTGTGNQNASLASTIFGGAAAAGGAASGLSKLLPFLVA